MDAHKQLLIANGEDKTDKVVSFQFADGKCHIRYSSGSTIYSYNAYNVRILDFKRKIDPESVIVYARGQQIIGIEEILDFGEFYRIVRPGKKDLSYRYDEIKFLHNCLNEEHSGGLFEYFKKTAATVSLVTDNGINILSRQYEKISSVREDTVLASYGDKLGLLKKLSISFRFSRSALKLFLQPPELVIPYLKSQFYPTKEAELLAERDKLEKQLANYAFDTKMDELSKKSLQLFRGELARRYRWREGRQIFERGNFRGKSTVFNQEYPVVLSTTYSIKGTLSIEHVYDYLIIDEASQADLATGVLAFSCAKNVIIVGDSKQLPNVLTKQDKQIADEVWARHSFDEMYHFATQSLLSSAVARWNNVPSVLLREHYRCHPKIIGFCNQKFYQGQLIVMTQDHGEEHVLTMTTLWRGIMPEAIRINGRSM